jgi:hypothetical protein
MSYGMKDAVCKVCGDEFDSSEKGYTLMLTRLSATGTKTHPKVIIDYCCKEHLQHDIPNLPT